MVYSRLWFPIHSCYSPQYWFMYQIPHLLRAPHISSEQQQEITKSIKKSLLEQKPPEEQIKPPEFMLDKSLDEKDFFDLIPQKLEAVDLGQQQKQYQPKNYLEEFFDQKGIIQKQLDRKKKMLGAMQHEIPKVDEQIDELLNQFDEYKDEVEYARFKINQIEEQADQLTLLEKLNRLDGDIDRALNLELNNEFMLKPEDTDPNEKLELMYEDTRFLIEEYDKLKERLVKQMEQKHLDEQQKIVLEQYDRRQEQDNKFQLEITKRMENIKNETIKLKLNTQLQKVQESVKQRNALMRRKVTDKDEGGKKKAAKLPQYDKALYQRQVGYGRNKVVVKQI